MSGFSTEISDLALEQLHDFILEIFQQPVVEVLRFAGHSLFVWGLLFALVTWKIGFKLTPLTAVLWGWLSHIITDIFTHVTDATPIFYPISGLIIQGPISYWHPDYFRREFNMISNVLMTIALFNLWSHKE